MVERIDSSFCGTVTGQEKVLVTHVMIEEKAIEHEDYFRFRLSGFIIKNRLPYSISLELCKFIQNCIKEIN